MQPFSEGDQAANDLETRYPQLVEEPLPLIAQLPEVPAALDEVVMRCLERDPARRPRTTECAVALEGIIDKLGLDKLRAWPRGLRV